jgi:SAM-dependent methyltransferase
MAKHLPPSGATLHLLDVEGRAGKPLAALRPDLDVTAVQGAPGGWGLFPDSFDAVALYDEVLTEDLLQAILAALRPGGRLIVIQPDGAPSEAPVLALETAGYTRILVESALVDPLPTGALIRGEKPHTEANTVDRVQQVARRDTGAARFVHLLIQQKPNKPIWALDANEKVEWEAVAVGGDNETVLLGFSSLPKAVAFMQPAVLAGRIQDVNKVAKFLLAKVRAWPYPLLMNPTEDILDTNPLVMLPVDPAAAEQPDE